MINPARAGSLCQIL